MMDHLKNAFGPMVVGLLVFFVVFPSYGADKQLSVFDLQAPIWQVVSLYYKEVEKRPFVVCDAVLNDTRKVLIRAGGRSLDAAVLAGVLDVNGYKAQVVSGGVVSVCTKVKPIEKVEELGEPLIYRPQFRDVSYLVELLQPLVKGTFANRRQSAGALLVGGGATVGVDAVQQQTGTMGMAAMRSNVGDDYLIFSGSDREREKVSKLLAQVDTPLGQVFIKGYIYEVGKNSSEASVLDMLVSVLKGKLDLSITGSTLSNSIRIKTGGVDLVASVLNTDGRFKVVSSPYARVRSGSNVRFQVGSDVPVLGSIVTTGTGTSTQSVEYRSAGTIFEVLPRVRDRSTDVDLYQQISSFVTTDTGVNGSPTLNKRELRTSLTLEDGEIMVIGGLNEVKEDQTKAGLWFLPFPTSRSSSSRDSELLLILELKRI